MKLEIRALISLIKYIIEINKILDMHISTNLEIQLIE